MLLIALLALVPFTLAALPKCAKTNIIEHHQIETNGVTFNLTISECAETAGQQHKPIPDSEVKLSLGKRSSQRVRLMKRQSALCNQCTLGPPQCICGVGCTGTVCETPRAPITQTDCAHLALALEQTDGTFLIEPGQSAGVSFKSCTYSLFNNEANNLQEYCFDVMGGVALALDVHCPGSEALCGGGTLVGISRFFVEQVSTSKPPLLPPN